MAFDAFAVAAPGLETLVADELRREGASDATEEHGGVSFTATEAALAAVLLGSRVATRVLVRIASFHVTTFAQLEQRAKAIRWNAWVAAGGRARFRVTCRKSKLYHSDAVAQRLAGALSARVRDASLVKGSAAEDEDGDDATQLFVVRVADNVCTISADASGAALHRRGYRLAVAKAPIRETLAAAMLAGAEWDASTALCDPMCGSGTIAIEAAMQARRIAPGIQRTFAAERWPTADARVWHAARDTARAVAIPHAPARIVASDRDAGAIAAARANAERAGVSSDVDFAVAPLSSARASAERGLLITNPPFGVRVSGTAELRDLYARFGQIARTRFEGWRYAILSADQSRGRALERQLALALAERWRTTNGGIPVRLLASATADDSAGAPPAVKTRNRRRG